VTVIQMVDSMFEIKSLSTNVSDSETGKCYMTSTHEGLTDVQRLGKKNLRGDEINDRHCL
jgi:hypothetical protein